MAKQTKQTKQTMTVEDFGAITAVARATKQFRSATERTAVAIIARAAAAAAIAAKAETVSGGSLYTDYMATTFGTSAATASELRTIGNEAKALKAHTQKLPASQKAIYDIVSTARKIKKVEVADLLADLPDMSGMSRPEVREALGLRPATIKKIKHQTAEEKAKAAIARAEKAIAELAKANEAAAAVFARQLRERMEKYVEPTYHAPEDLAAGEKQ